MNNNDTNNMNGVNNGGGENLASSPNLFNNGMPNQPVNSNIGGFDSSNSMGSTGAPESLQGMSLGSIENLDATNASLNLNGLGNSMVDNQAVNLSSGNTEISNVGPAPIIPPTSTTQSLNENVSPVTPSPMVNSMDQNNNLGGSVASPTIDNSMNVSGMDSNVTSPINAVSQTPMNNVGNLDSVSTMGQDPFNMGTQSGIDPNMNLQNNIGMNSQGIDPNMNLQNNIGMNPQGMDSNMNLQNNIGMNPQGMDPNMNFQNNMGMNPQGMDPNMNFQNNIGMNPQGMDPNANFQNNMGMNPQMGAFDNNMFGSVPTPPPIMNDDKKKGGKKLSKNAIIIIIVLLILLIGIGVYFLLNMTSKSKGNITLNDPIQWNLGTPLTTDISDYASISGFEISKCSLDTSKVDITKMGQYDFSVTCGTTSRAGKIVVQDKTAPIVAVKEVHVVPGTSISLEDFVVSCNDSSNCSYQLEDNSTSLEELVMNEGTYHLNLIVSDDYNNQVTVTLTLNVSNDAPVRSLYCTLASAMDDNYQATLETSYNYEINDDDILVSSQKVLVYTFQDEENYLKAKEDNLNQTGQLVTFDDENYVLTIMNDLTTTELGTEFNVTPFPTNYDDLKEFNLNQGISCKNR